MTGQDAVNLAREFHEKVGITGIVLTRIDGDARGGAALSMRAVTGKPIKLLGTGEKMDALDAFDAQRIAGSILGMGDIVGLVEKAQEVVEEEEAEALAKKMMKGQFTLEDMADQFKKIRQMGSLEGLLGMLPGAKNIKKQMAGANVDDKTIARQEAIISSMTPIERPQPEDPERIQTAADCCWLGHVGARGQPCAEAAQTNVRVHEESRKNGQERHDAWLARRSSTDGGWHAPRHEITAPARVFVQF